MIQVLNQPIIHEEIRWLNLSQSEIEKLGKKFHFMLWFPIGIEAFFLSVAFKWHANVMASLIRQWNKYGN